MGICACFCETKSFMHDPLPVEETIQSFSFHFGIEYVVIYWIRTYIEYNDNIEQTIIPTHIKQMISDYVIKDSIDTVILNKLQTEAMFNLLDNKITKKNTNALTVYENVRVNKLNLKFKLLYRASRDGWSPFTFHSKCDDIAPTITLHKSLNNPGKQQRGWQPIVKKQTCSGAYTVVPWSQYGGAKIDHKAFTFSLTQDTQFIDDDYVTKSSANILSNNVKVRHASTRGPCFESGHYSNSIEIIPASDNNGYDDFEVFHVY
eukprot:13332_1